MDKLQFLVSLVEVIFVCRCAADFTKQARSGAFLQSIPAFHTAAALQINQYGKNAISIEPLCGGRLCSLLL